MSDRIDFGGDPWKAIPRRVLRDKRLSAAAKGGLVTLLSHEEGWVRSVVAILMRENHRCGRAQARSILRELVDAGYAELNQQRNAQGKFSTAYVIRLDARLEPRTSLSPGADGRGAVSPGAGNRSLVVEPQDGEVQGQDPKNIARSAAPVQPTHDQIYIASQINEAWKPKSGRLTPSALVKLNKAHGISGVTSALRLLHGFPPEEAVRSPYAYIAEMCSQGVGAA